MACVVVYWDLSVIFYHFDYIHDRKSVLNIQVLDIFVNLIHLARKILPGNGTLSCGEVVPLATLATMLPIVSCITCGFH